MPCSFWERRHPKNDPRKEKKENESSQGHLRRRRRRKTRKRGGRGRDKGKGEGGGKVPLEFKEELGGEGGEGGGEEVGEEVIEDVEDGAVNVGGDIGEGVELGRVGKYFTIKRGEKGRGRVGLFTCSIKATRVAKKLEQREGVRKRDPSFSIIPSFQNWRI